MFCRLVIVAALFASAFAVAHASSFVASRSVEAAPVVAVQATRVADVVLLGAGFDAGLRQGMVCSVRRDGAEVGEVVLVDLRPRAGAALILRLAPGQSIQAGDIATVKTLKV